MQGDHGLELGALQQHLVDHAAEMFLAGKRDDGRKRLGQLGVALGGSAGHHPIERIAAEQGRLGVVEHLEMRRHVGLEREALQQPLAEAVDGEDLEPAARLERAREQAARRVTIGVPRRAAEELRQTLAEIVGGGRRPERQAP